MRNKDNTYEYKTTYGYIDVSGGTVNALDDPEVPDGDGWIMCGFTSKDNILIWSWKRLHYEN